MLNAARTSPAAAHIYRASSWRTVAALFAPSHRTITRHHQRGQRHGHVITDIFFAAVRRHHHASAFDGAKISGIVRFFTRLGSAPRRIRNRISL